jgi:hypothetical protein
MVAEGGAPRCVSLQSRSSAVAQTSGRGDFAQGHRQNARCEARSGHPSSARAQVSSKTVCDERDAGCTGCEEQDSCRAPGRLIPEKCVDCVTAAVYARPTGTSVDLV